MATPNFYTNYTWSYYELPDQEIMQLVNYTEAEALQTDDLYEERDRNATYIFKCNDGIYRECEITGYSYNDGLEASVGVILVKEGKALWHFEKDPVLADLQSMLYA